MWAISISASLKVIYRTFLNLLENLKVFGAIAYPKEPTAKFSHKLDPRISKGKWISVGMTSAKIHKLLNVETLEVLKTTDVKFDEYKAYPILVSKEMLSRPSKVEMPTREERKEVRQAQKERPSVGRPASGAERPQSSTRPATTAAGERPQSSTRPATTAAGERPQSSTRPATTAAGERPQSSTRPATTAAGERPQSSTRPATTAAGERPPQSSMRPANGAESSGERPTTPKSSSRPVVGASDQRDHQATAKTSPAN